MSAPGHLGEKLSAYLDDELTPPERVSADQHLRECAACAQLLEELAAVDSASRTLAVQAPEGYFEAFPARVRERLAARRARRVPAWTWAAAAAVLLAVLTPLTLRDRRGAPAAPPAKPARDESSFRRTQEAPAATTQAAATQAPPAPTLVLSPPAAAAAAAEEKDKLGALGYTGQVPAQAEGKTREFRQKRDVAQDDRLRERDADAGASGAGAVGGIAGPDRRGADLKDGELKKETFADKAAGDKLNRNAAAAPARPAAPPPATAPPAATAEQEAQPQLAARADEYAKGRRAEPMHQAGAGDRPAAAPPPAAEAVQASPAKPSPSEGAALRASKAASAPASTISADEAGFAEEFEALASRPLRTAQDARTAARQWSELARRHPQARSADEARVRSVEALATAWRLEHKAADRDLARKEAQAYLAAAGPQKDRVRAVLDQLTR